MTLTELFRQYRRQTRSRRNRTSQENVKYKGRQMLLALDALGVRSISDCDGETLPDLVDYWSGDGLTEHTVLSYARVYRAMMRWAARRQYADPARLGDMALRSPQTVKERYLSKAEIATLFDAVNDTWMEFPTALGVYQGMRRREVCELGTDDIDIERGEITVQRSKNHNWRVIRVHPALRDHWPPQVLNPGQPACLTETGRPITPNWLTKKFRWVVDDLGPQWEDVSFHTLRHTCASHMAISGNNTLYQIGRFLGHRSMSTTQKYAHLMPNQVEPAW